MLDRDLTVRVQDPRPGVRACVSTRSWKLSTLAAFLFEERECAEVRQLLARGEGVARGSRASWPPVELTEDEFTELEKTFPEGADRPLDPDSVGNVVLEIGDAPDGARIPVSDDDPDVRACLDSASYLRFDYGPWADVYHAPVSSSLARALLVRAESGEVPPAALSHSAERLAAGAGARLHIEVARAGVKPPWRETST